MKNKVKGKGSKENKSAKTSHCVLESAQKISADTHSKTISDLKLRISFGNWMDYKTRPIFYFICCRYWKHVWFIYRNWKSLFRCLNHPKRLEFAVKNCSKKTFFFCLHLSKKSQNYFQFAMPETGTFSEWGS